MKQLQMPPKKVALAHSLVSFALLVLILVFSFTPILVIDVGNEDMRKVVQSGLDSMAETVDGVDAIKIPEQIGVTMPKLLKTDALLVKVGSVLIDGVKSVTSERSEEEQKKAEEKVKELEDLIKSPDGQESLVLLWAILGQIVDLSEEDLTDTKNDMAQDFSDSISAALGDGEDSLGDENGTNTPASDEDKADGEKKSTVGTIILTVIRVFVLLYILGYITVLPIVVAITVLIQLVRLLKHLKNPEEAVGKIAVAPLGYLGTAIAFMLTLTIFNGMEFGAGLNGIVILGLIGVVANIAASRMRAYAAEDFRYVNLTQGSTLLGAIGGAVFFAGALSAKVFVNFCNAFGDYVADVVSQVASINMDIKSYNSFAPAADRLSEFHAGAGYLIDLLLISLFAIFTLSISCVVVTDCAARIGLSVTKKKGNSGFISLGVMAIICSVLPLITENLQNAVSYDTKLTGGKLTVTSTVKGAIYHLSDDSKSAVITMLVGGILMLAVGIATKILAKKLCAGVKGERAQNILRGAAPAVAAAPAAVETAPAAEMPAEEPAEAVTTEAAAAEAAPEEAAPAEEAPEAAPEAAPEVPAAGDDAVPAAAEQPATDSTESGSDQQV